MPVLIQERDGGNSESWQVTLGRTFHMSDDSGMFRTAEQLKAAGARREGACWVLTADASGLSARVNPEHDKEEWAGHYGKAESVPLSSSPSEMTQGSDPDGERWLPLYEAKMIHHYDHRWATFAEDGDQARDPTEFEKADPSYQAMPRYWVPEREIEARLEVMSVKVVYGAASISGAPRHTAASCGGSS